jgi:predicted RNA binding protein YcfA (HicA-like mRNA interferase family)
LTRIRRKGFLELRLPRDLAGSELAKVLARFGYRVTRQTGSHMRLTSSAMGTAHHLTIPAHKELAIGTLNQILKDVANYLEKDFTAFVEDLFSR